MKVAEILRLLQQDGGFLVAQRGSHRQFKHRSKASRARDGSWQAERRSGAGAHNSILTQARLKWRGER
jgi:predicted RNA binding protein YcfA (HicA-like mRNA interferase family)